MFLGAVAWAITRLQAFPLEGRHETTYFVLGIFVFAFLTGVIRTGVFALELVPTLYAVPVIATAIACVHTARRMGKFDPEPKHEAWLRFGGLVVSGLAITLALARPMTLSPLYSGNTLAVAVMALGLYGSLLVFERHPAYLYLAFGALFLAYFGAFYFIVDLLHAVDEMIRGTLGYKNKLPFPFKALNGLVLNPLLAFLSLYFARRWQDERLARHCHYIGLPLSILACALSTFEPKAAVLCLSAYAILYIAAVRIFHAPRLLYLATAALAGAVYFGTTFLPWAVPALQALALAVLGFAYWLAATILKTRLDQVLHASPEPIRAGTHVGGDGRRAPLCAADTARPHAFVRRGRGLAGWDHRRRAGEPRGTQGRVRDLGDGGLEPFLCVLRARRRGAMGATAQPRTIRPGGLLCGICARRARRMAGQGCANRLPRGASDASIPCRSSQPPLCRSGSPSCSAGCSWGCVSTC